MGRGVLIHMTILEVMQKAISMGASDVFLVAGLPVTFKCEGHQERLPDNIMKPPEIQAMVESAGSMTTSPLRYGIWAVSA